MNITDIELHDALVESFCESRRQMSGAVTMMAVEPRRFSAVNGYVADVDRWPDNPRRLSMPFRFAFVLDSARADCVDMFFDLDLYRHIVGILWKISAADWVDVINDDAPPLRATIATFNEVFRKASQEPFEPASRLVFGRGDRPALIAESEPWAHVGGPEPYHDSYAVAVFSRQDLSATLKNEAEELATRVGATFAGVTDAAPAAPPETTSKLRSAFRSFFR